MRHTYVHLAAALCTTCVLSAPSVALAGEAPTLSLFRTVDFCGSFPRQQTLFNEGEQTCVQVVASDADGDLVSVTLDWRDDTLSDEVLPVSGTSQFVTSTFEFDDDFSDRLTVTVLDAEGNSTSMFRDIEVQNVAPTGAIGLYINDSTTANPYTHHTAPFAEVGETLTFRASGHDAGDADVLTFQWDFFYDGDFDPDRSGVSLDEVVFPTDTEGNSILAFRVLDDDGGNSGITYTRVQITAPPQPPIGPFPAEGTITVDEGDQLRIEGSSSATFVGKQVLGYDWSVTQSVGGMLGSSNSSGAIPPFFQTTTRDSGRLDIVLTRRMRDPGDPGANPPVPAGPVEHFPIPITVLVENVAPRVELLFGRNAGSSAVIDEGDTARIFRIFNDASPADRLAPIQVARDFGDGTSTGFEDFPLGGGSSDTHVYEEAGLYTMRYTVRDKDDGVSSIAYQITVRGEAPRAQTNNTGSSLTVNEGDTVTLDGSSSRIDAGQIVSWVWDLGLAAPGLGGSFWGEVSGETATFDADIDGEFAIMLTVTDDDGQRDQDAFRLRVNDANPTPLITLASNDVRQGEEIILDASGSTPGHPEADPITDCAWEVTGNLSFDDAFGCQAPFSFVRGAQQNFLIRVRVFDEDSSRDASLRINIVNAPPIAVDDYAFTEVDTPLRFDGLNGRPPRPELNDLDPGNDPLNLMGADNAVGGTVSFSQSTITFTPAPGFTGLASFEYTVGDPAAFSGTSPPATGRVTVQVGELPENCESGQDEDRDGDVDCDDSDCAADAACVVPEDCATPGDEDGDGAADCADTDCTGHPSCGQPEQCTGGADEDLDGDIDCEDSDCDADAACLPPVDPPGADPVPVSSPAGLTLLAGLLLALGGRRLRK